MAPPKHQSKKSDKNENRRSRSRTSTSSLNKRSSKSKISDKKNDKRHKSKRKSRSKSPPPSKKGSRSELSKSKSGSPPNSSSSKKSSKKKKNNSKTSKSSSKTKLSSKEKNRSSSSPSGGGGGSQRRKNKLKHLAAQTDPVNRQVSQNTSTSSIKVNKVMAVQTESLRSVLKAQKGIEGNWQSADPYTCPYAYPRVSRPVNICSWRNCAGFPDLTPPIPCGQTSPADVISKLQSTQVPSFTGQMTVVTPPSCQNDDTNKATSCYHFV